MAKSIHFKDVSIDNYEDLEYVREDINFLLKNCKLINVETLKEVIRFWYTIE